MKAPARGGLHAFNREGKSLRPPPENRSGVDTANVAYYHDDPDQLLFLRFAIPQASYIIGGGHYVRGGSQALTDRLVALIKDAKGVLETGREANGLIIAGGRVTGVHHVDRTGQDVQTDLAPIVFGNAAPQVLAAMLPEENRQSFLAPYAKRRSSISLWTVSLGLNSPAREMGVRHYSTFILPPWLKSLALMRDSASIMGQEPGQHLPPYVFVDHSQIDSGLALLPNVTSSEARVFGLLPCSPT